MGKKWDFPVKKIDESKFVEVEVSPEINEAVVRYIEAKRQIEALENTMKTMRPMIEGALHAAGGKAQIAGFDLTLVDCQREVFALAKAKEKIDGRILRPYISLVDYTQIRVGRKL